MKAYNRIIDKCKKIRITLKFKVEEVFDAANLESIIESKYKLFKEE
jgi:hypothetical protein